MTPKSLNSTDFAGANTIQSYITTVQALADDALSKWDEVVFENPTNIGKEELLKHLGEKYGKILLVSQSYSINSQWNDLADAIKGIVFMTYGQLAAVDYNDIYSFCAPYDLIIFDEAHHAGAKGYSSNILRIINEEGRRSKVFGMTTHTKRYSDSATDVAYTIFNKHKISGISFEDAIRKELLPQFDYISALYGMPKDIDDLVASSSIARRIISDSGLIQLNEEGIKEIIKKHMPEGNRKVVYFVPTIEDSLDAGKLAMELGYGNVYVINYTRSEKENKNALEQYNKAKTASLICISKFNEGAIPKGTNTVVVLRRTTTVNIFERQVLTALWSAKDKPVVYDFVSNIDNLIYSRKNNDEIDRSYYAERIKSLCSQSIVVDYARQWTSVFNKLRSISPSGWTPQQDEQLRRYYPKYGNEIYRYIKGHNLKECLIRAEILGIEGPKEPSKPVYERKERDKPYIIKMDITAKQENYPGLSSKTMNRIARVYTQYLDTGRIDNKLIRKTVFEDTVSKVSFVSYADALIEHTEILKPECEKNINNRQMLFKGFMEDYAGYSNKKITNAVILNGKAHTNGVTKEVIDKHIAEKKLEAKKENMVLIGDRYMDKKRAVAGQFGETPLEHTLHKTYARFLLSGYDREKMQMSQFLKTYSLKDIERIIENLRNSVNPWSKEEENYIRTSGKNPEKLYKSLLVDHSDLDILNKAEEIKNESFLAYCTKRNKVFEKEYAAFLADYKAIEDSTNEQKEEDLKKRQREEENRKKKEADKQRMKTLKPTVVVINKRKNK